MSAFEVTFYGTRGSSPAVGAEFNLYGGNTPCVLINLDGRLLVLDAGTGIIPLGHDISTQKIKTFDIFLTHAHYDHMQGLPFFTPLMDPQVDITLWYAGSQDGRDGEAIVRALFSQPFLPFSLDDVKCNLKFQPLPTNGCLSLAPGLLLKTISLKHPGGCTGLRFQAKDLSFVYAPDFEHDDDSPSDRDLVAFLSHADFAILDATYTADDYPAYEGFGHTSWVQSMKLAKAASVVRWALFHHAHRRTDAELSQIEKQAKDIDERAFVARDGMTFSVCPDAMARARLRM
jgi:phosphoribosyl 1,2-cyclic phosphodiesterase